MMISPIDERDARSPVAESLAKGQTTKPCAQDNHMRTLALTHATLFTGLCRKATHAKVWARCTNRGARPVPGRSGPIAGQACSNLANSHRAAKEDPPFLARLSSRLIRPN